MNPALWVAKTGLDAQQVRMNVIANNLANVNTTGFKRDHAVFEDLVYQNIRQVGANATLDTELPSGLSLGTGVRPVATEKLFTQGNVTLTGNSMDIAIQGRGFFQILQPDGSLAYTRDGTFQVNADGEVVTSSGARLQPGLTIPPNSQSITIGIDGTVTAIVGTSPTPTQLGTLQLADFINPVGLQAVGENRYKESAASGTPQVATPGQNGIGTLIQGSLETSNVNVVEELVNMIETQRAYEMNSKAIAAADEMMRFVNNNL
ncbi:MAG: flagellar basal-body rod protein FlgG [Pseudomonadota bacterium]